MRRTRKIEFAFTAASIKTAADDLANSVKNRNGVIKGASVGTDSGGNPIGVITVEEDFV